MTAAVACLQPAILAAAPRCGARTRAGSACLSPAVRGARRCRMHGGKGSGAPRGNRNAWRHGVRSARFREIARYVRATRGGRLFGGVPPRLAVVLGARPAAPAALCGSPTPGLRLCKTQIRANNPMHPEKRPLTARSGLPLLAAIGAPRAGLALLGQRRSRTRPPPATTTALVTS